MNFSTPISQRYLAALDAYEEFVFMQDLLDRLDRVHKWAKRQREELSRLFYLVMGDEVDEQLFSRLWYVEVSREREDEAKRAVTAAADKYAKVFRNAALGRSELGALLRRQGLPDPYDVHRQAADRRPWWRKRSAGFYGTTGRGQIHDTPPAGPKYVPLNIPDPSAAINFWRANQSPPAQ